MGLPKPPFLPNYDPGLLFFLVSSSQKSRLRYIWHSNVAETKFQMFPSRKTNRNCSIWKILDSIHPKSSQKKTDNTQYSGTLLTQHKERMCKEILMTTRWQQRDRWKLLCCHLMNVYIFATLVCAYTVFGLSECTDMYPQLAISPKLACFCSEPSSVLHFLNFYCQNYFFFSIYWSHFFSLSIWNKDKLAC